MRMRVEPQQPVLWGQEGVKMALVGEAPGAEEESAGRPFVGAAGKELDRWISAAKIFRSQLFIGNLSRIRPPSNDLSKFFGKDGQPLPSLAADIQILVDELKALRPNVVVTLGKYPLKVFTGQDKIFNWWGSVIDTPLLPGVKLVPLPHPAFIIRGMWRLRPICATFLKRAKEESFTPDFPKDDRTRLVYPTIDETLFHLDRMLSSPKICLDIEDPPPFPRLTCIGFTDDKDWSICIPFVNGTTPYWSVSEEAAVIRAIDKLLRNPGQLKIAHNFPYDFTKLAALGFYVAPPYWDTMKAHNRLFPDFSNKTLKKLKLNRLAFCTALYTRHKYYKDDYKVDNVGGPSIGGTEKAYFEYNCNDVMTTFEVQGVQEEELKNAGLLKIVNNDLQCFRAMMFMSLKGVARDREKLRTLREKVNAALEQNQKTMDALAGKHVNPGQNKKLCKLLYEERGLPAQWKKTTTGQVLTADESALLKNRHRDQLIPHILFHRRLSKFKSTYLESGLYKDRTHTTYNDSRTSMFRWSSSGFILGGGLNLQTIPSRSRPGEDFYNDVIKEFKMTFIPDPGKLMWKRDYKQAEAVYVAYDSQDLPLIDDINSGIDIHCRTASYITGEDYQKIFDRVQDGDPIYKFKRRFAKPVKHGSNYKMSYVKLQELFLLEGILVSAADCKRALAAVLEASPYTVQWHKKIEEELKSKKIIRNAFGHLYTVYGIVTDDEVREALAFGPQSTVGLMTQYAGERVYRRCDTELLMNVHDALIGQSKEDLIIEHLNQVEELMKFPLTLHGRSFTIETDAAYGPSWGEMKELK